MHKIILRILYNGRKFHGFQRQPNVVTVEGELERILSEYGCLESFRTACYAASGRTDRGVHAFTQTISFYTSCSVGKVIDILGELEPEIHVWAYRLDDIGEFHPRYWALWREYVYVSDKVNVKVDELDARSKNVIKQLIGCRDYSFLGLPRTAQKFHCIFNIKVVKWKNRTVYHIVGSSFARQMIRRIISLLEAGDRFSSAKYLRPASPENLLLFNVRYNISFKVIDIRKLIDAIKYHSRKEVVFEYLYQNYVSRNVYWYDVFV